MKNSNRVVGKRTGRCILAKGRTTPKAKPPETLVWFSGAFASFVGLEGLCRLDTLMNRFYTGWRIELHPEHGVPYIREITESESYMVLRLPKKETRTRCPTNSGTKSNSTVDV